MSMADLGVEIVPLAAFPHFRELYDELIAAKLEYQRARLAETVLLTKMRAEAAPTIEARNETEYAALLDQAVTERPERASATRRTLDAYGAVARIEGEIAALQATLNQRQVEAFEGRRRWLDVKATAVETGLITTEEAKALEGE